MSWLARSLASSLNPGHRDDDATSAGGGAGPPERSQDEEANPETPNRGVKEDISELTETITRQFWGVASFLAPPPPPPPPPPPIRRRPDPPDDQRAGIREDFREIGGRWRSGISRFSNHAAVTEISKIASNFLPFVSEEEAAAEEVVVEEEEEEEEDEEEDEEWAYSVSAVGLTDEVLAYARNISMHPETWLDFPLFYDFEDCDDFDMSDAQQEHAFAVEHLLPRLAALRIELCPAHMTKGCFWKIYFVLLHSRLNKHDAELLSTPQIVEAKAMLLQRLQEQMKSESDRANRGASYRRNMDDNSDTPETNFLYEGRSSGIHEAPTFILRTDNDTEKPRHFTPEAGSNDTPVVKEEPSIQSKNRATLGNASGTSIQNYIDDHDGDEWLEEESRRLGVSGAAAIHLYNDEDVSFSDLEDDDDCTMPSGSRTMISTVASQTRDTKQWSQLNQLSGDPTSSTHTKTKGTDDWLSSDDDFDTFMRQ